MWVASILRCMFVVFSIVIFLYSLTYYVAVFVYNTRARYKLEKSIGPSGLESLGMRLKADLDNYSAERLPGIDVLNSTQVKSAAVRDLSLYNKQFQTFMETRFAAKQRKLKHAPKVFPRKTEECRNRERFPIPLKNITDPMKIPKIKLHSDFANPCFCDSEGVLRCLPSFFILSPQKSGTTDLYHALTSHPQIVEATKKEPHWFDRTRFGVYAKYPTENMLNYTDYFQPVLHEDKAKCHHNVNHSNSCIIGDFSASTIYDQLLWNRIPENAKQDQPHVISAHEIRHILPKAKFIVLLRDPVSRFHSDWFYYKYIFVHKKSNALDLHRKTTNAIRWMSTCLQSAEPNRTCYYRLPSNVPNLRGFHPDLSWHPVVRLRVGLYSVFLKDWFSVFPREQFYVTLLDDYARNKEEVLQEIFDFLGVDKNVALHLSKKHYNAYKKKPILTRTRALLHDFYNPYIHELANLLRDDKYLWES